MTAVKLNLQKLENLVKSATNARQRKMYQSLLDKARRDLQSRSATATVSSNSSQVAESKADKVQRVPVASSTKKSKQSQPTEEQVLPHSSIKERVTVDDVAVAKADNDDERSAELLEAALNSSDKALSKGQPTADRPAIFQAIGLVRCVAQIKEGRLTIVIDGQSYELRRSQGRSNKQFKLLKQDIEQNGSRELWLRVYPKVIHDSNSQRIRYWFILVKAYLDESQCSDLVEGFVFRGIWQRVQYCSEPVIMIYRNLNNLKFYQQLSPMTKRAFVRPQAFTIVWSAPIEPFRYHPKLDEDQQMPCYFVQVRAVFKDGGFEAVETIEEPTLEIPKYIKPVKKTPKRVASNREPIVESDKEV